MPHLIGEVTGTLDDKAHFKFFNVFKNFANNNGWTTLMENDPSATDKYVLLKGTDITGDTYIGLKTYGPNHIAVCASTGYLPSQTFDNQPNMYQVGIPLYYDKVRYWITLNNRRIAFCCQIGTAHYESGYIGRFIPYASPLQYPYPVACAGMFGYYDSSYLLSTNPYTYVYSSNPDYYYRLPYKGTSIGSGSSLILSSSSISYNMVAYSSFTNKWFYPVMHPYNYLGTRLYTGQIEGKNTIYELELCVPNLQNSGSSDATTQRTPGGIYGKLDGIYYISGSYMYPEDTLSIDGYTYIVFRDKNLDAAGNHYVMRLDPNE